MKHVIPLDHPFFNNQVKVVLTEVGQIDPESIEDYLAHGGYKALMHVLQNMTPEEVCEENPCAVGLARSRWSGLPNREPNGTWPRMEQLPIENSSS